MADNREIPSTRLLWGIILLWCCVAIEARSQQISDIIQPIAIFFGTIDTVLMSDCFYATDYDLKFRPNSGIKVSYDRSSKRASFKPATDFHGATCVEFILSGKTYSIPVIVRNKPLQPKPHVFRYVPTGVVNKVIVTGSFNNWNKEHDQLTRKASSGIYELTMHLDPGSYLYKFIVDGKEMLDSENPEKAPAGFDDFNSVVRVADPDTARRFLHIGGRSDSENSTRLSFVYDNTTQRSSLTRSDVIALVNNSRVEQGQIQISGDKVVLTFGKPELLREKVIRVMVTQDGEVTNIQQVVLRNGITAGANHHGNSWYDGMIYSIMVDRFKDGDTTNDKPVIHDSLAVQANYRGGDFKGIIGKIEEGYFDSLGINILWISPVYDNPDIAFRESPLPHRWYSGYHGYWPISDTAVEEKFGTMAELKELIGKAHQHGIKVLLDFVAHHVHIDHPFYKEHPEWFGTLDLPDGRRNLRLWDEFRLTTWFEPYMPSFDFTRSAEAVRVMSDNAVWWLKETGADGFRHDAVKHVPYVFWRELTRKIKEQIEIPQHIEVYQIGETFGDYDLVSSYINNGQLSAQFNFDLSYFAIPIFLEADRSFSSLDFHMKKSFASFGMYNLMGNIMDSHDKVRFMAYADGKVQSQGVDTREMAWKNPPTVDHPSSYRKAELYLAYMFTIPGLPVIYYGSEFGMTGADDPDNRRMMRFDGDLSAEERAMLARTKIIVALRAHHPALRYGDFVTLRADTRVYAYLRSDMNERVLIVLNKSGQATSVDIALPSAYESRLLKDIIDGTSTPVQQHSATVTVPPLGWRVFTVN
jgi:cyclomaltodextrinase